ncbi:MAG: META domain-containing protein [Proteobacteria bacterium]|nr:META domain-containing protein [Pseudomonadota bacterium]
MTSLTAAAQLAGSEWRPTEIGNIEVPAGSQMFVGFGGEGKVVGHGGCNRFFGTYNLTGISIEIGALGTTRMACPEPVMEREVRFLQALEDARQLARDGINMSLTDDAGNPLVRLLQTDAD